MKPDHLSEIETEKTGDIRVLLEFVRMRVEEIRLLARNGSGREELEEKLAQVEQALRVVSKLVEGEADEIKGG